MFAIMTTPFSPQIQVMHAILTSVNSFRGSFKSVKTTKLCLPMPKKNQVPEQVPFVVTDFASYSKAYDWLYRTDYGDYIGAMTVTQVSDTRVEIRTESDCIFKNDDGEQLIERGSTIVFDMNDGVEISA